MMLLSAPAIALAAAGLFASASEPIPRSLWIEAAENVSVNFAGTPRLQSFAWAQWEAKWIFIGGRTGGYHGVGQGDVDFPRAHANVRIWVIEPPSLGPARVCSFSIADLPASLGSVKDQWMSSNLLHFQENDTLYLAGGYGENANRELVTYPIVSSANLPALVDGVIRGKDTFSKTISWAESPLVQSAGGELVKLDDGFFYLIAGHVFTGSYRGFEAADEKNSSRASQTYLGEIRKLRLSRTGADQLEVSPVQSFSDPEFARRDLNATLTILDDGKSLGAAAYGGVFTKDQLNFTHPIWIKAGAAPQVEDRFGQKMSAYSCATMLLYDSESLAIDTTFFGGISRWRWNDAGRHFVLAPLLGDKNQPGGYLDGLPWVNEISTLVRHQGKLVELAQQDNRLPGYVGANGAFPPAAGLKRIREDAAIFDLPSFVEDRFWPATCLAGFAHSRKSFPILRKRGTIHRGTVPTKPNDMILKVYVTALEPGRLQ